VYTSGTTGMPKGVMISHDSYTWTKKAMNDVYKRELKNDQMRLVSYLPLSHVAAQFSDIVCPLEEGAHLFFADPSALQGSLIQTLQ
jgi:long-chain-fatty-acid--CoA ligase ACSBG